MSQERWITRRRLLWGGLSALAGGAGLGYYTCRIEPHWIEWVRRDLPVSGLPEHLRGATLVQLSDLHVGPQVDDDYIRHALAQVAAIEPDFVVYTGDFMTSAGAERLGQVGRTLAELPLGRRGTAAILGNHDSGHNWKMVEVADRLTRVLGDLGATVLRNQSVTFDGLHLVGLEDYWGPNWNVSAALDTLPRGPAIALCHNPDGAEKKGWDRYRGWILSGHTHGGQCKAPLFRPPVCPVENKRFIAGEYDIGSGRHVYINRGLGHIVRARFNARPEITLFRLIAS